MKKEQLYEALGEISENYIAEAHQTAKKEKCAVWVKWAAMAACLCLAVAAFVAPSLADYSQDFAQTVIYNNAEYTVCGSGEVSILTECGFPAEITKDLAGRHLGFFALTEKNTYKEAADGDAALFEYAPQPNDNVYIFCIAGKYYAAIRTDNEGYHGLPATE